MLSETSLGQFEVLGRVNIESFAVRAPSAHSANSL